MLPPQEKLIGIATVVLFVGAAIWLGSILTLMRRLEKNHPETYRALGEPSFHRRYTGEQLNAALALVIFILKREHRSLNDVNLSRLCDFMQLLFIAYLGGFIALLVYLLRADRII